jgi:hypothetical protein
MMREALVEAAVPDAAQQRDPSVMAPVRSYVEAALSQLGTEEWSRLLQVRFLMHDVNH